MYNSCYLKKKCKKGGRKEEESAVVVERDIKTVIRPLNMIRIFHIKIHGNNQA